MCGIIGIASNKSVTANIIQSLKRLEYRGYDSSGIANIVNGNIDEKKCAGRVENLEKILFKSPSNGSLGIGHVRWLLMEYLIRLMRIHIHQRRSRLYIMEL